MTLALRPYQRAAVDSLLADLDAAGSALVVAATGTGKTAIITATAQALRERTGKPVLVLAQRRELLVQVTGAVSRWTKMTAGIECADERVERLFLPDVVAASVGSMQGARLLGFARDAFGAVLVDEAHHAVAPGHRRVLDHFAGAKRAGFTATADRLDGAPLGAVFARLSYEYPIKRAIEEGFLSPVRQVAVDVDGLDFSAVRKTAGEFNEKDLEKLLAEDGALHGMAVPTLELAKGRPGIMFGVTVAHAEALVRVLNDKAPRCAALVHGGMMAHARAAALREYSEGRTQLLVNVALLTEGVDLPRTAVVSMARPTLSRGLYTQMIGRGTRLFEGKRDCLVIDFAGNAGRHKLVTAFDVLGDGYSDDERARAGKLMATDPTLALLDALKEAKRQIAEERAAEVRRRAEERAARQAAVERAQREAEDRTRQAAARVAAAEAAQRELFERMRADMQRPAAPPPRVSYSVRAVDPFTETDLILGLAPVARSAERAAADPPSDAQLGVLERAGYDVTGVTKRDASTIIGAIMARREAGLCTVKMARLLAKHGLRVDLSMEDARAAIDAVANNHWRVPLDLPAKYRAEGRPALGVVAGGRA